MRFKSREFIVRNGLYWPEILRKDVPKSKTALQPIFEAFTNSLEAIQDKQKLDISHNGEITIKIYVVEGLVEGSFHFKKCSLTDNGIGFTEDQFERFNIFRDVRKNYKNLGSGRIQYAHYFDKTEVESIFEFEGNYYKREFFVSKGEDFLKHNAIVYHRECSKIEAHKTETTINFNDLTENSEVYNNLNEITLKEKLLERYINYFCYNKNNLPKINIEYYIHSKKEKESEISILDLPAIDQTKTISLFYSKKNGIGIEKTTKSEDFIIDAYKISKDKLKENRLNLVSKGEVIEESNLKLENLASNDQIEGNRYLFLVSSPFIDERDTNIRGVLNIPQKDSSQKELFENKEEIYIEDIQEELNKSIDIMYPKVASLKEKQKEDFIKLKEMFLLDENTAKEISISINDSESDILKKFYEYEAKKIATFDASIKQSVDRIESLNPLSPTYQDDLKSTVDELVKKIPLENQKTLTHYVARRKLVLDLFQKILDNETNKVKLGGRIDEDVLHNLIFQQSSDNPIQSDLWLVNEEYIYFKGVSEGILGKIELDGQKIIKEVLTEEEQEYRLKQGGDARLKRTDILLFPAESKCIIIELKAPGENVSEHLNQINRYASLINNLSLDSIKFNTFYGYLIGESIDSDDIIDNDSDFKFAPYLGYVFRPYKRIVGKFGRKDGSLYTEIIKYSTLLDRAKFRNKIFIDTLK